MRHVLCSGEGAEYVRLTFGTAGGAATEVEDPSTVIDAEFLFLKGVHLFRRCCNRHEQRAHC